MAYEKAVAAMFYKNQQETEWLQARHRAEQTAKELEQKQIQRANLIQLQEQLQQQLKKEEETRVPRCFTRCRSDAWLPVD